ncbi:MAG: hypothetical protein BWY82_02690 [Verrucomicrobia bacterium ADurb.Bin474]|nr:MAG: hypothetical protein BWY82_02690 [Verrucomicrobia bacterium ADurb.Bin474]
MRFTPHDLALRYSARGISLLIGGNRFGEGINRGADILRSFSTQTLRIFRLRFTNGCGVHTLLHRTSMRQIDLPHHLKTLAHLRGIPCAPGQIHRLLGNEESPIR